MKELKGKTKNWGQETETDIERQCKKLET